MAKLDPYSKKLIVFVIVGTLVGIAAIGWGWSRRQSCQTLSCPDGQTPVRLDSKCVCLTKAR